MRFLNNTVIKALITSFIFITCASNATDNVATIKKADRYFLEQKYNLALNEYLVAAETVSPKAYYQLGVMHYKGLGTAADNIKALVWFSMAADFNYDNSVEIVNNLIANVQPAEKAEVTQLIKSSQEALARQLVYRNYAPIIIEENLSNKLLFDDMPDLSDANIVTDMGFSNSLSMNDGYSGGGLSGGADDMGSSAESFESESDAFPEEEPYFLIADYDVGPDGSIRNITEVKASGDVKSVLFDLSFNTLPKPTLNDKNVYFVNRTYLGIASYNKWRMQRDYNYFYTKMRKLTSKLDDSDSPKDKYNQAMALLNFPWLKQEKGYVDQLLKAAAEHGYVMAKYEYGLKLYREQTDFKQAVHWIFEAAKQEHSHAQYRLARILQDSPWVVNDENNALFWFEQASEKDHLPAKLKTAEIKLVAKDEQLIDVDGAIEILADIAEPQADNPEYHYLQAMAHLKMEPRQLAKTVEYLESAIKLGNEFNWDTSAWQKELDSWTSSGSVTIVEGEF
ncbi:hypothetical protein RI845_03200 [Thalassotalea nanhaiensis]|uniref:Sel1 repeat family protein n=1 Tax=Thalassotalea nanhaiensis TaxID=3065648 RepID=A0ABY9TK86_9GAMM|nr:hypothetical protein RI845_03200 [Colwelliaceae bacterium SQ345]